MTNYSLAFLLFLLLQPFATATEPLAAVWSRPAQVHWEQTELRPSLVRLAEAARFGLLVDRRVDPSISVTFSSSSKPLATLLKEFTALYELDFCPVQSVAYIGPPSYATPLPFLLQEQRATLANSRRPWADRLQKPVAVKIPLLGEPKSVLARLARENQLTWANLDELPHDLWNETNFPPMPLGDVFTLLLIGFDRTWTVDESTGRLRIIPFPMIDESQLQSSQPKVKDAPQSAISPLPLAQLPLAQRRFTEFTVKEKPLGEVLNMLAERLNLELQVDENSLRAKGVSMTDRVSVEVRNATVQEMLRRLLSPLKLEFQIRNQTLVIR